MIENISDATLSNAMRAAEIDRTPLPNLNVGAFVLTEDAMRGFSDAKRDRVSVRVQFDLTYGGVKAAIQEHSSAPTPNALFVEMDTSDRASVFDALDALADVCDPGTKVIVVGKNNDVSFYRALVERGVSEYLVTPVDSAAIVAALSRLYGDKGTESGRIIAVCGAKGGVGASTISHHLAYSMAQLSAVPTLLIDFDIAFGTAALAFDQSPTKGTSELLFASQFDLAGMIERLKFPGGPNLSVIGTSAALYRVFDVTPEMVGNLLQHIRKTYPLCVIDVPHVWNEWVRFTLSDADDIVLVTAPDIPSFRNTKSIMDALVDARPHDARPTLVLNMANNPKRMELRASDFQRAIGIGPDITVAYSPQIFSQATNEGRLIFNIDAKSKESKTLNEIAETILLPASQRKPKETSDGLLSKLKIWK